MTKTYITIKDGIIKDRFITNDGISGIQKSLINEGKIVDDIVEVPYEADVQTETKVVAYDKSWKLLPLSTLIKKGIVILDSTQKLIDEKIVLKTLGELIVDGIENVPKGMLYDKNIDSFIPDPNYVLPTPTITELTTRLKTLIEEAEKVQIQINEIQK